MIRYWDYTEKQRAALTRDQVQAMLTVELMEKGVLDPGPSPEQIKPEKIEIPKTTYYQVRYRDGYDKTFDIAFKSADDAIAFINLSPMVTGYEYAIGDKWTFAKPISDMSVQSMAYYNHVDVQREQLKLKRIEAENKANKEAIERHAEALKKMSQVTDGVWEDWQECIRDDAKHKSIIETFNNYCKLSNGDEDVARKFLAKAYPEPAIVAAFAWCEVQDPDSKAYPANDECESDPVEIAQANAF